MKSENKKTRIREKATSIKRTINNPWIVYFPLKNKKFKRASKENDAARKVWIESKAAAEKKVETAKNRIFSETDEKAIKKAFSDLYDARRAVSGWRDWFNMNDADRLQLAMDKAAAQAVKQAEKRGKNVSDIMQFASDAAQEAIIYIMYDMNDVSEYGPESILSYIAGKYISSYMYNSTGRNGREESLEDEKADIMLYSHKCFGPGPEADLLANDTFEEIICELKEKDRDAARLIIAALKAGYNQSEIASALNVTQPAINYKLKAIKAAARIVETRDKETAQLEKDIAQERDTDHNNMIYRRESRK